MNRRLDFVERMKRIVIARGYDRHSTERTLIFIYIVLYRGLGERVFWH
jgi:hypothetical protein